MLGKEIENAIDDAWARIRREILADPAELHRRLARRRGRPRPLLNPPCHPPDPAVARVYPPPHPPWGSSWEFLSPSFPDDFEQTILRRPVFRRAKLMSKPFKNSSPPLYHDDLK